MLVAAVPPVAVAPHWPAAARTDQFHLGGQPVVEVLVEALETENVPTVELLHSPAGPLFLTDEAEFFDDIRIYLKSALVFDESSHGEGDVDGFIIALIGVFFLFEHQPTTSS